MKKITALATLAITMVMMVATEACSPSSEDRLKEAIETSNKECPTSIDHVTTLMEIKIDGDFVTYMCEIDERQLDMDSMLSKRATYIQNIHNTVRNQITNPQSSSGPFFSLIRDAGKGLRHRYRGNNSRKTLDVDITNDELKQMTHTDAN